MKEKKGYTLVELLVAFAIFGILIIPIIGMINTSIKGNKSSKEKLELVNVYNYAYESYLNNPKQEENYMGYTIKFNSVSNTEYELHGIDYNNFDVLLRVNENVLEVKWNTRQQALSEYNWNFQLESGQLNNEQEKVNNIRINIKQISDTNFLYKVITEKITNEGSNEVKITEIQEKEVNNPTGNILFDVNCNSMYRINLLVDGIYKNDDVTERLITVNVINKLNDDNIKLASVYPNVEFVTKENINLIKNQNVEYVRISIYKGENLIDEKIYEFSKTLK